MKFVYVDESGDGKANRFLTFFGLQVDAYRLKTTTRSAMPVLRHAGDAYPSHLRELKSSRMVNGVGEWRAVDPEVRKELFVGLCGFPEQSGARAYAVVLDCRAYATLVDQHPGDEWLRTPWHFGATTIAMLAQKHNQQESNNKGLTVLIFDDNKVELPKLSEFLMSSSPVVDGYYGRSAKADPFDHIVDTAFAVKSEHSTLVQIADACAYALRRRAEIEVAGAQEAWPGERDLMVKAFSGFKKRILFPPEARKGQAQDDASQWIRSVGVPDFKRWVTS